MVGEGVEKLAEPMEEIASAHRRGKRKVVLVVVEGSEDDLRKLVKDSGLQAVMLCRPDPARKRSNPRPTRSTHQLSTRENRLKCTFTLGNHIGRIDPHERTVGTATGELAADHRNALGAWHTVPV